MRDLIWIDWLGNVRDTYGRIGHLIAGPLPQDGSAVYVIATGRGREIVDWKNTLIQLRRDDEARHFRGVE